jgi:hypothetical protein
MEEMMNGCVSSVQNLQGRAHLENLSIDEIIILKLILEKYDMRTGVVLFMIDTSDGLLKTVMHFCIL